MPTVVSAMYRSPVTVVTTVLPIARSIHPVVLHSNRLDHGRSIASGCGKILCGRYRPEGDVSLFGTGTPLANNLLNKSDSKPTGVASNATGTTQWVMDGSGSVFVYDNAGTLLGQWQPQNVGKPEGITVWNNNLWLVDPTNDRVYAFTGGASLRTGKVSQHRALR